MNNALKTLMIATALVGATATASAFAQSTPPNAQQPVVVAQATGNAVQAGQWVSPDAQANTGKTRAQVYQELVQAEKDGQLDYLNSTIYAH